MPSGGAKICRISRRRDEEHISVINFCRRRWHAVGLEVSKVREVNNFTSKTIVACWLNMEKVTQVNGNYTECLVSCVINQTLRICHTELFSDIKWDKNNPYQVSFFFFFCLQNTPFVTVFQARIVFSSLVLFL